MPLTSVKCEKCLGFLEPDPGRDRYLCPKCNLTYTGYDLFQRRLSRGLRRQPDDFQPGYEHQIQQLVGKIDDLKRQLRRLENDRASWLAEQALYIRKLRGAGELYRTAKVVVNHAFAGSETPDEDIEDGLSQLIKAVSNYGSHAEPLDWPDDEAAHSIQPVPKWVDTYLNAKVSVPPNVPGISDTENIWFLYNLDTENIWLLYEANMITAEVAAEVLGFPHVSTLQLMHRRRKRAQFAACLFNLINKKIDSANIGGHE